MKDALWRTAAPRTGVGEAARLLAVGFLLRNCGPELESLQRYLRLVFADLKGAERIIGSQRYSGRRTL